MESLVHANGVNQNFQRQSIDARVRKRLAQIEHALLRRYKELQLVFQH